MQFWSFYFLGKLLLYYMGSIRFDFVLDILLAGLLALPVPERFGEIKTLKFFRIFAGILLAFMLFWHETWFPPLRYAFNSLTGENAMSGGYMIQFVLRAVNPVALGGLVILFILYLLASKRFNLSLPVILLMLIILPFKTCGSRQAEAAQTGGNRQLAPLQKSAQTPGGYFAAFHKAESSRAVKFEKIKQGTPDFDIVVLHI